MVHVPIGKAGLAKLIVPVHAVVVPLPPPALRTLGVVATTMPAGRVSVKLESIVTIFALVMLNVIVLGAFTATGFGPKLWVMEGGCRMMIPTLAKPPLAAPNPAVGGKVKVVAVRA